MFTKIRLMISAFLLLGCAFSSTASPQQRVAVIDAEMYPSHLLKVIEVRNVESATFAQDLEIEVEKVSGRPIFGAYLMVTLNPENPAQREGLTRGLPVHYGRGALADIHQPAAAGDIPIKPGEKVTLKVNKGVGIGTQQAFDRGEVPPSQARRLEIIFQTLNFGDGNGVIGKGLSQREKPAN